MSKPIVVIVCMVRSSESWEPQQRPHPWHRCAGGGAVHSINNGQPAALSRPSQRVAGRERDEKKARTVAELRILRRALELTNPAVSACDMHQTREPGKR